MPGRATKPPDAHIARAQLSVGAFTEIVGRRDYPCLGARSVIRRDRATVGVYGELDALATAPLLLHDLKEFACGVDLNEGFASFIAIFRGPRIIDERHFERLLWSQLRRLHALDEAPWSEEVSADSDDEGFAFSVAGSAYFLVGMHPMASRVARRAASPILVFNLHAQFEALRASGDYPRTRDRIRNRDEQLQGSAWTSAQR